jgi:hypothetical protein
VEGNFPHQFEEAGQLQAFKDGGRDVQMQFKRSQFLQANPRTQEDTVLTLKDCLIAPPAALTGQQLAHEGSSPGEEGGQVIEAAYPGAGEPTDRHADPIGRAEAEAPCNFNPRVTGRG